MRCKLGDISEITKLAGYEFTKYVRYIPDGEIIAVRALNLKNGTLVLDDIQRISKEVSETLPRSQLHKNDIVLSYTGTLGECAQIQEEGKYHLAPNVCKITPNGSVVNPNFLFQYIRCDSFKQTLINYAHGSTQPTIPMSTIRDIPVVIPDNFEKQGKIAAILSALDEKIAINREINENLERQAQALYRAWFVDFSVFGGTVPNDWQTYQLAEFLPVITGKKNANVSSSQGKYPFFSCSQDYAWTNEYSFDGSAILVAGNGDFNVKFYSGQFEAYQRTYVLIPNEPKYTAWLFYAVQYHLSSITSAARGSVIKFITKGNLEDFKFVAPKDPLTLPVVHTLDTINKQIAANREENIKLGALRDTLLPKLMSGELDVSDLDF